MATARQSLNPDDPDVLYLKLPNRTSFSTVGNTLARLDDVLRTGDDAPTKSLLLDLRSVVFCSATGITILAALLDDLYRRGKFSGGQVWLPSNRMALNYLKRMNFFKELNVQIEEQFERRPPSTFSPVTHIPDQQACTDVTRELVAPCQKALRLDDQTARDLRVCINEIIENVFVHANSPTDALVSTQAYKSKRRVELVIADTGRGVREAFARSDAHAHLEMSDCEAIRFAMQKNVSTTGDDGRGIGLWFVSEVARVNQGEFLMLSREGGVRLTNAGTTDVTGLYWPGTLVAIEFRLDMPLNMKDVYDSGQFPDVYGDSFSF